MLKNKNFFIISLVVLTLLNIAACAPLLVASTASTVAVIADRRTTGTVFEDQAIELKAFKLLHEDDVIHNNSKVSVSSFNERILVTGQANSEDVKNRIEETLKTINKVRTVYNEVKVAKANSFRTSAYDSWLTTKVKAQLTGDTRINPIYIKVTTEDKVVYLTGLVTAYEASAATDIARKVSGVNKVVRLFEYIQTDHNEIPQYALNEHNQE